MMRQPRREALFGWLLALLFPLFVPGVPAAVTAAALTGAPATAEAAQGQHPLSRKLPAGERHHAFASALATAGAAGSHPAAALPPGTGHPPLSPGFRPSPARDDGTRSLAALLVRPGRAPPSTDA
ncbi:hypothetical protein ACFFMN_29245 [Planobispora siamensis]|nr:hypothetical protein [Planobispora siamensis]